jgi:hypothetical protein
VILFVLHLYLTVARKKGLAHMRQKRWQRKHSNNTRRGKEYGKAGNRSRLIRKRGKGSTNSGGSLTGLSGMRKTLKTNRKERKRFG